MRNKFDFCFNGVWASALGLGVAVVHPPRAAENVSVINIPGRLSPVEESLASFSTVNIPVNVFYESMGQLDLIYSWLRGKGELILASDQKRFYKVHYFGIIIPIQGTGERGRVSVEFVAEPFRYAVENSAVVLADNPSYIMTGGTMWSEPVFHVSCGETPSDVTITANGVDFTVESVSGDFTIDVPAKKVYRVSQEKKILLSSTGYIEDMVFVPSETEMNRISWQGDILQIEVVKNERWL